MPRYYYVVDTSITNDAGVAVGQSTYDLLVDEKFRHGVIPLVMVLLVVILVFTLLLMVNSIGIHTTKNVGIAGTVLEDFHLKVHGDIDARAFK